MTDTDSSPVSSLAHLDPELARLVLAAPDLFAEFILLPDNIELMRDAVNGILPMIGASIEAAAVDVEELVAREPGGDVDVALTVIRPRRSTDRNAPCLYFMHGGGLVSGHRLHSAGVLIDLVTRLGITAVSVEYRLAPEHPLPSAIEDVLTGWRWLVANAQQLGIDGQRMIIGGESAGGCLAAAAALALRDTPHQPIGSMLLAPMLDDRDDTGSTSEFAQALVWNRISGQTAWAATLGADSAATAGNRSFVPARAADVSGMAATYLDVGSVEMFRDEVVAYAERIWAAGGAAELHVWPGCFHAFDVALPAAAISHVARQTRANWIARVVGQPLTG